MRGTEPVRVGGRRRAALLAIAGVQLVLALDATVIAVALPTLQVSLGISDADRAWVVTAYTVAFGGLLLAGGRLGDRFGARRAFLAGLVGFGAASGLAAAASGPVMLIIGRALQGACAAVIAPAGLSMLATTFPGRAERARAFGVYGAVAASGGAVGLVAGGLLTQFAGWRWCLGGNAVLAAAAVVLGAAVLPRAGGDRAQRIDPLSAVLATVGIAGVVLGCSRVADQGWVSVAVLPALATGAAAGTLFAVRQRRLDHPLLPLGLLAGRRRAGAHLALAAAIAGSAGTFLVLSYRYQAVWHWSPALAGVAFLPLSVALAAGASGLAGPLLARVRPVWLIVPGLLVAAGGAALVSRLDGTADYPATLLPAQILLGLGVGCVVTPAIAAVTTGLPAAHSGVAAAAANTSMQVGGSVGVAALNTIAVAAAGGSGDPAALAHGFAVAAGWTAALLAAAGLVAAVLLRRSRGPVARPGYRPP